MTSWCKSPVKVLEPSSAPGLGQNKDVGGKKDKLKGDNGEAPGAKRERTGQVNEGTSVTCDRGVSVSVGPVGSRVLDVLSGAGPAPEVLESVGLRAVRNTTLRDLHSVGPRAQSEA